MTVGISQFTVMVDYTLTVEQMVTSGCYDRKDEDITSQNFPVNKRGNGQVTVHLAHFNLEMDFDNVILKFDAMMGLRPAELPELLALGAAYPYFQRNFPIIALGSVWQDRAGGRHVPYLDGSGSSRYLYLYWDGYGWDCYCRFAAVGK